MGLRGGLRAGLRVRGGRTESALLPPRASGARNCILLLIHQTLHLVLAPGAGICAGRGAGGGLDRHPRLARSSHPLAHRGRPLLALVYGLGLGALSLAGVAAVTGLLIYEHSLVKATDLSRVDAAFFTMNGYVSMLFFVFWAADVLWKS